MPPDKNMQGDFRNKHVFQVILSILFILKSIDYSYTPWDKSIKKVLNKGGQHG